MRAARLIIVLAFTWVLCVPLQSQAQDHPESQPSDEKVITDTAEYNAYLAALNTLDAVQKAAALEAFIDQFPNSMVKDDALRLLLTAYSAANNQVKVEETTWRILKKDPDEVRVQSLVPTRATVTK